MRVLGLAHPPGELGPVPGWVSELGAELGEDFGDVSLQTGVTQLRDEGANAATDGRSIAFADARPSRETVAHELAHVVQHRRDGLEGVHHDSAFGTATSGVEQEAEALAECAITPTSTSPAADHSWSGSSLDVRLWAFGVGSHDLAAAHQAALDDALASVEAAAAEAGASWVCHSVVGHASPEGGEDANRELGLARAAAVASHLGLGGELRTRGEADAANADVETYPYHRAVELVFEVLDDCDAARVVELEAEIAALSEEAAELLHRASVARQLGEESVDGETGSGRLRTEDESRLRYFLETFATAVGGVNSGPAEWAAAEAFDERQQGRAEVLEAEAEELRQQVDQLRALAEAVE